jgi:hypothetical protein
VAFFFQCRGQKVCCQVAQHNDIQQNDIQHNNTKHDKSQHNGTEPCKAFLSDLLSNLTLKKIVIKTRYIFYDKLGKNSKLG